MLFAYYGWAVGAGLAYLLLLFLATAGLLLTAISTLRESIRHPDRRFSRAKVICSIGFAQAWVAYVMIRVIGASPATIEIIWAVSIVIVVLSIAGLIHAVISQ
jgi:hypothetical protein